MVYIIDIIIYGYITYTWIYEYLFSENKLSPRPLRSQGITMLIFFLRRPLMKAEISRGLSIQKRVRTWKMVLEGRA